MKTLFTLPRPHAIKTLLCASALALAFSAPQTARAWGDGGWGFSDNYLSDSIMTRDILMNTQRYHDSVFGIDGSSSKKKRAAKPKKNPAVYSYTYSAQVSKTFEREFIDAVIARARDNNALTADVEAKIRGMENWNYISSIRNTFQSRGHNPDNIATALAFWLAITYGTIHNIEGTSVNTDALQDQLEIAMSQDKDLQSQDDTQKQRIAENLLWNAAVQLLLLEEAGNDASARQGVAQLARDNLKSYGIDPDAVKIDSSGLQLR